MHPHHQDVLIRKRVYILEELEPANILHRLLQDEIIKSDQYDDIDVDKTRKAKVTALLSILPHCGPKAFSSFISALKDNQKHVAQELMEGLNDHEAAEDSVFAADI